MNYEQLPNTTKRYTNRRYREQQANMAKLESNTLSGIWLMIVLIGFVVVPAIFELN